MCIYLRGSIRVHDGFSFTRRKRKLDVFNTHAMMNLTRMCVSLLIIPNALL